MSRDTFLDPTEPMLNNQIDGLKLRRAEAAEERKRREMIRGAVLTPPSPDKIARFSDALRQRLTQGEAPLRKAYLRAFVDRTVVERDQIMMQGRKDVLASAAAKKTRPCRSRAQFYTKMVPRAGIEPAA